MNLGEDNSFGNILGVDYFGSLIGTILYSLFLYPTLGLFLTAILITFVNLITAVLFLIYKKKISF
jgi:spermidine synthase